MDDMSEISPDDPNIEYVDLQTALRMVAILADRIRNSGFEPDLILAITPGGSMIGELLSYYLGSDRPIRMLNLLVQTARDEQGRHTALPQVIGYISQVAQPGKVLIVNDISRSGQTLEAATAFVSAMVHKADVMTAVLYLAQDAKPPLPEIWLEKPTRKVVFSWKKPQR